MSNGRLSGGCRRVAALYRLGVWSLPPDDGSAAAADDDGYEEITGET